MVLEGQSTMDERMSVPPLIYPSKKQSNLPNPKSETDQVHRYEIDGGCRKLHHCPDWLPAPADTFHQPDFKDADWQRQENRPEQEPWKTYQSNQRKQKVSQQDQCIVKNHRFFPTNFRSDRPGT